MQNAVNIPTLAEHVTQDDAFVAACQARIAELEAEKAQASTKAMFRTVRQLRSNLTAEDGTPVTYDGLFMETFTFGKVRLHAYLNLELNRIDCFTNKGYPLSHSAKSLNAARFGAREEIKKIQKRNAYRASVRRAA